VKRFRGGLVVKAHRLVYHSTLEAPRPQRRRGHPCSRRPRLPPTPRFLCLCLYLSDCLCLSVCLYLCVCLCLSMSVSGFVSLSDSLALYVCDPNDDEVFPPAEREREFFIDTLLVRIHFVIVMIRQTGLAPWELEFPPAHLPHILRPRRFRAKRE